MLGSPPEAFEVDAVHRTGDSGAVAAVGRLASGIDCLGLGECLRIPLEANSSARRLSVCGNSSVSILIRPLSFAR